MQEIRTRRTTFFTSLSLTVLVPLIILRPFRRFAYEKSSDMRGQVSGENDQKRH